MGALLLAACSTLGSPTGVAASLPSANMGPFRKLTQTEEPMTPFVLDGAGLPFREPSALAVNPSDPSSPAVFLYVASTMTSGTATTGVIARTRADDGRSFYGTALDDSMGATHPKVVLTPSAAWEGSALTGPSAIRVGGEIFLYYAAAGGIGLARSSDGLTFTKTSGPVLAPDPKVTWEKTGIQAPSVAELPDGTFDMMYSAGDSIGEATSRDGLHFTRQDADPSTPEIDPVLRPLASPGPTPDGAMPPFDTGQVADPCVLPQTTPAGRLVLRVLYTGYATPPGATGTRASAIGFAARYGTSGPLTRQTDAVFTIDKEEAAPSYFAWSGGEMLYVHANNGGTFGSAVYQAVAAGFAPPESVLPPPSAYPGSP